MCCRGEGARGQLGLGDREGRPTPSVRVSAARDAEELSIHAGEEHTCELSRVGPAWRVACVGRNDDGQLGDGTREDRDAPVRSGLVSRRAAGCTGAGADATVLGALACPSSLPKSGSEPSSPASTGSSA
ncbi:MAG: hypothetical protein KF729_05820 [Sandaracinaceae bacterium]|nr:hypothetical protein [Sandaracinaceae bacterium]